MRFSEEIFLQCLENPALYMQTYQCKTNNVAVLVEKFPQHKERLIAFILQNEDVLQFLVENIHALKHLVFELFPEHKDELIKKIFLFKHFFVNICPCFNLSHIISLFPDYTDRLFQKIFSGEPQFRDWVDDPRKLLYLATLFPLHKNKIWSSIISNLVLLEKCNLESLILIFSENRAFIFRKIFLTDALFAQKVENFGQLSHFVTLFPEYKHYICRAVLLNQSLLKNILPFPGNLAFAVSFFQDHKSLLLAKMFEYRIHVAWGPPASILQDLVTLFPEFREKIIIDSFCDLEIFKNMVAYQNSLRILKEFLPEIRDAKTVMEVKKILQARIEMRKASRIIVGQVDRAKTPASTLFHLPRDVRLKIADMIVGVAIEGVPSAREFCGKPG